jgi:threonine/homoserine/homoserine lactone efflux protein
MFKNYDRLFVIRLLLLVGAAYLAWFAIWQIPEALVEGLTR